MQDGCHEIIPYKKVNEWKKSRGRDRRESELRFQGNGISAYSPAAFQLIHPHSARLSLMSVSML